MTRLTSIVLFLTVVNVLVSSVSATTFDWEQDGEKVVIIPEARLTYRRATVLFQQMSNDTFRNCTDNFSEFNPVLLDFRGHRTLYMIPNNVTQSRQCIPKIYTTHFYYLPANSIRAKWLSDVRYMDSPIELPVWTSHLLR